MPQCHVLNMCVKELLSKMKHKHKLYETMRELSLQPKMKRRVYTKGNIIFEDSDEEETDTGCIVDSVLKMRQTKSSYEFQCKMSKQTIWLQACEIENYEAVFLYLDAKYAHIPSKGDLDVIIGGPPCQSYSSANRFRNAEAPLDDARNQLVISFIDIVEFLQPKYILIENVPNMLNSSGVLDAIYNNLNRIGFTTEISVLASMHYGLPQTRARSFIWGARDLHPLPHYPPHTHACRNVYHVLRNDIKHMLTNYPQLLDSGPLPQVTVRDLITDLPKFHGGGQVQAQDYDMEPLTVYQERMRSPNHKVTDHDSYDPSSNTLTRERMNAVPLIPGANYKDMPVEVLEKFTQESIDYRKDRCYARMIFFGMFCTVTTTINPASEPIMHPRQRRVFSVREFARAQGFPDWFEFRGNQKKRYKQIGNAVPVILSQRLAEKLMSSHLDFLVKERKAHKQDHLELAECIVDTLSKNLDKIKDRVVDEQEFAKLIAKLPEYLRDPSAEEVKERRGDWDEKMTHIGKRAHEDVKQRKQKKRPRRVELEEEDETTEEEEEEEYGDDDDDEDEDDGDRSPPIIFEDENEEAEEEDDEDERKQIVIYSSESENEVQEIKPRRKIIIEQEPSSDEEMYF
jgi:DNA (cytosine-5)-methyltransferase 1